MIRINLLPVKKKKKKPAIIPVFVIITLLLTMIAIVIVGIIYYNKKNQLEELKNTKIRNEEKIKEYKEKLKELKGYEDMVEDVKKKKKVIIGLRENQAIPVKILDELSKNLPESVWFKQVEVKNNEVELDGYAFTNSDVVKFVNRLKKSPIFKSDSVVLIETRREELIERELKESVTVYNFKLSLGIKG